MAKIHALIGPRQDTTRERRFLVNQLPGSFLVDLAKNTNKCRLTDAEYRAQGDQRQPFLAAQEVKPGLTLSVLHEVRQGVLKRSGKPFETLVLRLRHVVAAQLAIPMADEHRVGVGRDTDDQ